MKADLLGFDVRRRHEDYVRDDWDKERRNLFLLRPEVPSPSSVDSVVWPSVFDYVFPGSVNSDSKEPKLRVALAQSQTRQMALGLWPSATEMWLTFSSRRGASTGIPIAVYLLRDASTILDEFWDSVLIPALSESALPPEWSHLGYDIADRDFISGLSNCGYLPAERSELRQRWASRIMTMACSMNFMMRHYSSNCLTHESWSTVPSLSTVSIGRPGKTVTFTLGSVAVRRCGIRTKKGEVRISSAVSAA